MGRHKVWLGIGITVVALAGVGLWALPEIVRRVALTEIPKLTGRAARIRDIELNLFTGRFTITGFRLADRNGSEVFLAFERLDGRLALSSLLRSDIRLDELRLTKPIIRVVRTGPTEFNVSDLLALFAPDPTRPSRFTVSLEDFALVDGAVLVQDRAVSPVTDWGIQDLSIDGAGLTTRTGTPPGRLTLRARVAAGPPGTGGAPVTIDAPQVRLAPLAVSAQVVVSDLALVPLVPYLGPELPAVPTEGRAGVALGLTLARDADAILVRVSGDVGVDQAVLIQRGRAIPFATVARVTMVIKDLDVGARRATIGRVGVDGLHLRAVRDSRGAIDLLAVTPLTTAAGSSRGTPSATTPSPAPPFHVLVERLALSQGTAAFVDEAVSPTTALELSGISATVDDIAWPPAGGATLPTALVVATGLPGGGHLEIRGRVGLQPFQADVEMSMRDAPIEPYGAYLPVRGRLSGRFSSHSHSGVTVDGRVTAVSKGSSWIQNLEVRLPGAATPAVALDRLDLAGIDLAWPTRARVERVLLRHPVVRVERGTDGTINLRSLLVTEPPPAGSARAPLPGGRAVSPPAEAGKGLWETLAVSFGEVVVEDGDARFLDRTTTPAFSEELTRLAVTVKNLSNAPGQRATLSLQAIVGGDAALDLRGEIAPLGANFSADLAGDLRDFTLADVNPYTEGLLSWIIGRGKLAAKVRYRVEAGRLTGEHTVVVADLQVTPSRQEDEVKRRIGLPLGLIVALIKDQDGDIRVSVPISGSLTDPHFDWNDSIWAAVKNVLVSVIASPFKAIGRLFTREGKIEEVGLKPVTFQPGSAVLDPAEEGQLTAVVRFLHERPAIKLALKAKTNPRDVESLKGQELAARIQGLERDRGLPDFASAVRLAFTDALPNVAPPSSAKEQVARLTEREPVSAARVATLAARRLAAIREALTGEGGVQPGRLSAGEAVPGVETAGEGRVEFTITD